MRLSLRFLLFYVVPFVAGLGAAWVFADSIDVSMHDTLEQPAFRIGFRLVFAFLYTGIWLVGTLCYLLARQVIRKWRTK
ncbi:hypothetical protein [Lacipirellula limnantheis]|uniref:Uncharacterized protein n=1 Tax=Lacipirellula limnantheis TaxID=2528024 RepID=A0A517U1S5_9BACT|nr:hypothetical protein [Lacipirellula limnantheis]QDT74563.1 hypothetical protein I41_37600 [Lacipirellula limnantheis]